MYKYVYKKPSRERDVIHISSSPRKDEMAKTLSYQARGIDKR